VLVDERRGVFRHIRILSIDVVQHLHFYLFFGRLNLPFSPILAAPGLWFLVGRLSEAGLVEFRKPTPSRTSRLHPRRTLEIRLQPILLLSKRLAE
jgi:hypothetical protein